MEKSHRLEKPVLINYTTYGIGYNEFDKVFLSDRSIAQEIHDNFVVVNIIVDDKAEFQIDSLKNENYNFLEIKLDSIKTKGELNRSIQKKLTQTNTQPLYQIVNNKYENLIEPFGYTGSSSKLFLYRLKESFQNYNRGITKTKKEEEIIIAEYLGMMCDCPQWKLLTKGNTNLNEDKYMPIDTIELIPINSKVPNPLLIDSTTNYRYKFKGRFYKDKQLNKYDGNLIIEVKTFVYSEVEREIPEPSNYHNTPKSIINEIFKPFK